jgi:hypothetical protein
MRPTEKEISQKVAHQLLEALKESLSHHEYCGWGDSYERELAREDGLEKKIHAAINAAEDEL